jgi:DNA-binding beta-propeller fold protein YncE
MTPISTATNKAGRPFRVGFDGSDILITADGRSAYVFEQFRGVVPVNLVKHTELTFIKVADASAIAMTPNGKTVYVAGATGQTTEVTPIRTASNTALKPIRLKTGGQTSDIVVAPNGKTLYVVTVGFGKQSSAVTPIKVTTGAPLARIKLSQSAIASPYGFVVTPDSRTAYVGGENGVTPINLLANTAQKLIKLPSTGSGDGYDVGLSPDGSTVYATDSAALTTTIPISVATNTALKPINIALPGYTYGGMASPSYGKTVYILSYKETGSTWQSIVGLMTPINTVTRKAERVIRLQGLPEQIVFKPLQLPIGVPASEGLAIRAQRGI